MTDSALMRVTLGVTCYNLNNDKVFQAQRTGKIFL